MTTCEEVAQTLRDRTDVGDGHPEVNLDLAQLWLEVASEN